MNVLATVEEMVAHFAHTVETIKHTVKYVTKKQIINLTPMNWKKEWTNVRAKIEELEILREYGRENNLQTTSPIKAAVHAINKLRKLTSK